MVTAADPGDPASGVPRGSQPRIVVLAPFVVLALALVGNVWLSDALTHALGGFISFAQFGPIIAWSFFAVFAAVFLWLDALVVSMRADSSWPSVAAMWWTTALSTAGALIISMFLGTVVAMITVAATAMGLQFVVLLLPGGAAVAAAFGWKSNVRNRRAIRIAPRPF